MKVDITSSMIEKSIDLAKSFLSKLIGPAIDEVGLLAKDHVMMWKFKNQVNMLNKAMVYCEKHNISPKTISLKLLCPLLDYAALEDDEKLQDKWANLLANMVDSEQNIDNHVFPYLLSQISITEFVVLEDTVRSKKERIALLSGDLNNFKTEYPTKVQEYKEERIGIDKEIAIRKRHNISGKGEYIPIHNLENSLLQIQFELEALRKHQSDIETKLRSPEPVNEQSLKDYELGNLIRLGIVKAIPKPYASSQSLEIPNEPDSKYLTVDLDIEIHADHDDHILTQLGEMFVTACSQRKVLQTLNII
ncbi:Abi-alpha family protein [Pedobacter gandavensis]|uniref:Abi-alpha family protein n=1 Tax=Pedobacter gandavensis TaxID=2679963 RepID=UPI00292F2868|nr:Abi-alpha family protein [Pedobacter gandavensis]